MPRRTLPSAESVREVLDYDPATGVFTWLPRPREHFPKRHQDWVTWNKRFAGKEAGTDLAGYKLIVVRWVPVLAHKLAWLLVHGEPVPVELDHIDRNRSNNRIDNLRPATRSQNRAREGKRPSITGARGVFLNKRTGRFYVQAKIGGKSHYFGSFATVEEGAKAYREAAIRLHGDFASFD